MVEVKLQIPSSASPGASQHRRGDFWSPPRGRRSDSPSAVASTPAPGSSAPTLTAYLFNMPDNGWLHRGFDGHGHGKPTLANLTSQARQPRAAHADQWLASETVLGPLSAPRLIRSLRVVCAVSGLTPSKRPEERALWETFSSRRQTGRAHARGRATRDSYMGHALR